MPGSFDEGSSGPSRSGDRRTAARVGNSTATRTSWRCGRADAQAQRPGHRRRAPVRQHAPCARTGLRRCCGGRLAVMAASSAADARAASSGPACGQWWHRGTGAPSPRGTAVAPRAAARSVTPVTAVRVPDGLAARTTAGDHVAADRWRPPWSRNDCGAVVRARREPQHRAAVRTTAPSGAGVVTEGSRRGDLALHAAPRTRTDRGPAPTSDEASARGPVPHPHRALSLTRSSAFPWQARVSAVPVQARPRASGRPSTPEGPRPPRRHRSRRAPSRWEWTSS